MIGHRFLDQFDKVAKADGFAARLRQLVLDLAVRGKLTGHSRSDEPADCLIQRIQIEKQGDRVAPRRRTRRESKTETPFALPAGWSWSAIGEVTADHGQVIPQAEFTYIDVSAIDAKHGCIARPRVLAAADAPSRARKRVEKGDVIYSCVRPYLLNVATIDEDFEPPPIASTAFAVMHAFGLLAPRYLWVVLRSSYFVGAVERKMRGQAYPAINDADLGALPIPIPPLPEQYRIVAEVNQLLSLCDELESAHRDRANTSRKALIAAKWHLERIGEPGMKGVVAAPRLASMLGECAERREDVADIREAVFNLAVTGKLLSEQASRAPTHGRVPPSRSEEKVTARTVPQDRLAQSSRKLGEFLFEVPDSWKWVQLSDLCRLITSGSRGWASYYAPDGPLFIRAQNIRFGSLDLREAAHVSLPATSEGRRTGVRCGDLFVVITGAGVTNPAMLDEDIGEAYVSQHVALISPHDPRLSPWMLLCLMATRACRGVLLERAYGAGKPGLNLQNLRTLWLPLPPLVEQHKIVLKVNELASICDEYSQRVETASYERRLLLEALIEEALTS